MLVNVSKKCDKFQVEIIGIHERYVICGDVEEVVEKVIPILFPTVKVHVMGSPRLCVTFMGFLRALRLPEHDDVKTAKEMVDLLNEYVTQIKSFIEEVMRKYEIRIETA